LNFGYSLTLNIDKDLAAIRKQVLSALIFSKEYVKSSVLSSDLNLKNDFIWRAYSQAELAIGLAKLSYKDQIKSDNSTFRDLKTHKNRMSNEKSDSLSSKLMTSEIHLEQAAAQFREERPEEGLKEAREARDILKLLVLEETLLRSRKPKAREGPTT
jgi:hypothetical protein